VILVAASWEGAGPEIVEEISSEGAATSETAEVEAASVVAAALSADTVETTASEDGDVSAPAAVSVAEGDAVTTALADTTMSASPSPCRDLPSEAGTADSVAADDSEAAGSVYKPRS